MNTKVEIGQVVLEECYRTLIAKGDSIFISGFSQEIEMTQ